MIITITFENGNIQYVEGLPDGWTYLVEDNDVNGFDIGVWKSEEDNVTLA